MGDTTEPKTKKQTKPHRATPLMRAVRELRFMYRLSQRAFADFIGAPRGRIATIEAGFSTPSDVYLRPFAQAAGVTVEEFKAGQIAVNRCPTCEGIGVVHGNSRKIKRARKSEHPRTPTQGAH